MTSFDEDEAKTAPANRSQTRKRFDLGGHSSAVTSPRVALLGDASERTTARPAPRFEDDEVPTEPRSKRPTIPTPRPRPAHGAIPRRVVDNAEMLRLPLDHRAAFVLMHIDGTTNLRTLIDVTGMIPDEVVTTVERLLELHAITLV